MISIVKLWTVLVLAIIMTSFTVETLKDDSMIDQVGSMKPFNKSAIIESKPWGCSIRLSLHVRPNQYVLYISPNIENSSFFGYVEITITLDTSQSYIKLHSKGLEITETKLDKKCVTAFSYTKYHFWVVVPDNEICAGIHQLQIHFNGCLSDTMTGFYRSSYTDVYNNEKRFIAITEFEPADARSAFPCFDEPLMKSKFQISITRPSDNNFIALSNMNQESEEVISPANGLTVVHFANTVPMSTYLICFVVCDFESTETDKTAQGFSIRIFSRHGHQQNMTYAKFVALKSMNFYLEYLDIKYPLPKLDFVALAEYDEAGMENWGLVVFREDFLEYNESTSPSGNKEQVATTICHELAHMWFGDFVTIKWWNDLWLNEGFADYLKKKALEVVQPDWDYDVMFLTSELYDVLNTDSAISSHPIVQGVYDPDQMNSDTITYNKGAAILRMLEGMLGNEVFKIGIISYLKNHQFSNAQTEDLCYELQTASKSTVDIQKVVYTWTRQSGLPVITATRNGTKLILKQHRFLIDPNATYSLDESPYQYKWEIPLTYITSKNDSNVQKLWLCSNQDSVIIDISNVQWIKINYRQNGYYVVNYSNEDWCLLSKLLQVNINALSAADRANLLFDAFNLAEATYISYDIALDMTKYLISESHYVPWNVAFYKLCDLFYKFITRHVGQQFAKYLQHLLGGVKEDLWNDSTNRTYLQIRIRPLIIKLGCLCGVPSFKPKIYEIFKNSLDKKIQINVDIKYDVYCYGIVYGDTNDWKKVWDLFLKEQNSDYLAQLTYTTDTSLLLRLLQYAKSEKYEKIISQNIVALLYYMCQNPLGIQLVWNFIRDEWKYLVNHFTLSDIGYMITNTCNQFQTRERFNEVVEFYKNCPNADTVNSNKKTVLQIVLNNIKWLKQNEPIITYWFKMNNY